VAQRGPHRTPIVWRLPATRPDFLGAHRRAPERLPFLLESASFGTPQGRYDLLLAASPEYLLEHPSGAIEQSLDGPRVVAPPGSRFLSLLDEWAAREAVPEPSPSECEALGPFVGGWFVYLGYEFARNLERSLTLPAGLAPVAYARRVRAVAVYDHATGSGSIVHEPDDRGAADAAFLRDTLAAVDGTPTEAGPVPSLALTEEPPEHYTTAVRRALEYIAAGDIYQANLARAWRADLPAGLAPEDLYDHLRRANPGPFAGIATLPGGHTVLSTSPERLVARHQGRVETRPIAGTRPRRGDDAAVRDELRSNTKEQAEHVMLLDLERNDLGRISVGGSVRVDEYMTIESYAHVHHIVSNVVGVPRADVTAGDIVRALFPGGTITGCPKVRCMQIIAQLEGRAREAYTGSFGYLGRDGRLDLNILIRTALISTTPTGRQLTLHAGAGIVADSDPERELEETRAKARGLMRALGAEAF